MKPTNTNKGSTTKVVTPEFRVSFPQVFTPKGFNDQEPKYSVVMLFDKKTDISALKKAASAALTEKWGDKSKWPKNLRLPFRDGAEKEGTPGYENCIFVTASSKQKPGLVDKDVQPIIDQSDFYAGCYARATLNAFAYDMAGNKGVSFGLNNLQKIKDGKAFSGRTRAEDDFEPLADSSDDIESYDDDSEDTDELGL